MNATPPLSAKPVGATAPVRMSRTRKALIEAGKRLLSNGSIDGASIDDIVREADVAKGSFYNHFASREALAEEVMRILQSEVNASVIDAQRGVTDPAALLARGLLASFRYGLDKQLGARAMLHVTPLVADPMQPGNSLLVQHLRSGMTQRVFKLEREDAAVVLVMGLSDLGLARLLDLQHEFQQSRRVMREICLTLLRALGVDPRRIERTVEEALAAVIDAPRHAKDRVAQS